MKIKDEIKEVKGQFQCDETLLESVFRIEIFWKKYKLWILGLVGLGVVTILGYEVKAYLDEKRALEITTIFDRIQSGENQQELYAELQNKGAELYEFLIFSKAITHQDKEVLQKMQTSSNPFIARYARYEFASLSHQFKTGDYGNFTPLVALQEGYLGVTTNKYKEALEKLNLIEPTSEFKEWALRIGHYGIAF